MQDCNRDWFLGKLSGSIKGRAEQRHAERKKERTQAKTRKKNPEKQRKDQENASHTQSKNPDPNSKGEASTVLCSSSQGLRKQGKTKKKKNSRRTEEESRGEQRVSKKKTTNRNTRTEGKGLRGGGRENSPGVLELLLSPAPSNRQVRLSCYLHFCAFWFKRRKRGEGNPCAAHAWFEPRVPAAQPGHWLGPVAGPGWLGPAQHTWAELGPAQKNKK